MKNILKTIYDVLQCLCAGLVIVTIMLALAVISLSLFYWIEAHIPYMVGSIFKYIINGILILLIIFGVFGLGNEYLKKF